MNETKTYQDDQQQGENHAGHPEAKQPLRELGAQLVVHRRLVGSVQVLARRQLRRLFEDQPQVVQGGVYCFYRRQETFAYPGDLRVRVR